mmetsp:Transcript_41099/g.70329  ORF Transcript_41099/g.70329 Transcript_41099/m.70329 type:complete len:420 (+) Transcript_41099:121-1380(+)
MNTFSIDTLADAALQRDSILLVAPPSVSPSLSASSLQDTTSSPKPSGPTFASTAASVRRSHMPTMAQSAETNTRMNHTFPHGVSSSSSYLTYRSALRVNEQRSIQSMHNLEEVGGMSTGIIPASTSTTIAAAASAASVPLRSQSQVFPSATDSFSSRFPTMKSQSDADATAPSRRRKPNFAEKLHSVLNNKECRHAIAWLPSGRSFCITNQEEFVKKILPKFFREAKFESFSRRLKRWGFRKVYTTGLSQTIFSHDLFHRDRPDLCKTMNGRERTMPCENNQASMSGSYPNELDHTAAAQLQQFRNAMVLQQAKQQMAVQQIASLPQSASFPFLGGYSTNNIGDQFVTGSMSQSSGSRFGLCRDPSTVDHAKFQMARLSADIAHCEEQLATLHNLKEVKERRRQFAGDHRPHIFPPSFI